MLGVSVSTLRRWDAGGKLVPERTPGGRRRYRVSDVATFNPLGLDTQVLTRKTVAYARVSSHDQKADLERQRKVLEMYCAAHGWEHEVIADPGFGMNYEKKGLVMLLDQIVDGQVGRLVLTHKDRLLRFGASAPQLSRWPRMNPASGSVSSLARRAGQDWSSDSAVSRSATKTDLPDPVRAYVWLCAVGLSGFVMPTRPRSISGTRCR